MTKKNIVKYKICKQIRQNLWNKPLTEKVKIFKGHKLKKLNNQSEYALKLQQKQKLKKFYGNITESQFYNLYLKALKKKGKTTDNLLVLLERRLDSVLFRMNFTNSIFHGRQLINHNLIKVNGKIVNIPSYQVKDKDLIEISDKKLDNVSKNILFSLDKKLINRQVPSYLEVNYNIFSGIFLHTPNITDLWYPVDINVSYIIEFYSKN